MAPSRNPHLDLWLVEGRTDLGQRFLRFSVLSLMPISILAPVVRLSPDFWLKLDQLLLPVVILIYVWLVLAGFARPIRLNGLLGVALTFCVCITLSLLYGTQVIGHPLLTRDFFELPKAFFPMLFFTLAYEADFPEASLRTVLSVMLFSTLLICLYAYGQWFGMGFTAYLQPYYSGGLHDEGSLAHYRRVYSTLSNPNFLGMLMTWVNAAFGLAVSFRVGNRFWNLALYVASLATLIMTGSRYGLIDTVLAVLVILTLPSASASAKARRLGSVVPILVLAVAASLTIFLSNRGTVERFQQLRNPLQENSLRMRLDDLWKDAIDQFLESPLLGHGPAKVIFSDVYTDSEYLQILKQYGIVGLVSYLGYFFVPLYPIWLGLRRVPRAGAWLESQWPATYWALGLSFVMVVTALFMNIGMGTYYNSSLVAFLWMWMGIGASCGARVSLIADRSEP